MPAVVAPALIEACREHLRLLQDRQARLGSIVTAPLANDPFLARMARDSCLAAIAGGLLGEQPVPFGCTYFVKEPRHGLPVLWHQDGYPWQMRFGVTAAVTIWVALDRADEETGGMRVIPGSHALPAQPLIARPAEESVFGYGIAAQWVDPTRARHLALSVGDVSAHHPNLIHGSQANRSEHIRRALAIRYRPA